MKITTIICLIIFFNIGCSFSQFVIINTNTNEDLYEIDVFNDEAFIVGNNNYLAKLDIQNNQTVLKLAPGPDTNVIHSFNRIDTGTVFIVSSYPWFGQDTHLIYRSDDNCESWDLVFDTVNLRINKLLMFDSLEGIFVNSNNKQFRTINAGLSWNLENTSFFAVSALEKFSDSIVCMGMFEQFAFSNDRGRTWDYNSFFQYNPTSYAFINEDSLLAICGNVVTKTEDKGNNWDTVNLSDSLFLIDIKEKSGKIYSVGKWSYYDDFGIEIIQGVIARSLDSGQNWQYYNTGLETWFQSIEFLNDSVALICGTNGVLIKYNYRDHHLGFEEVETAAFSVGVYPNPTTDIQTLQINSVASPDLLVELMDVSGKKIAALYKGVLENGTRKMEFDLGFLTSGFYFYKVSLNGRESLVKTQKL